MKSARAYFDPSRVEYPEKRQTGSKSIVQPINWLEKKEKMEEQKNKLYVGNLPYSTTDESLKDLFAGAGEVVEAKVITDKFSGRSKGFGFVTMKDDAAAEAAIAAMDGKEIEGRQIKVNVARPMRER
ncbi:MAG: RNA-binding protein [Patescibacteria group bacterium]